MPELMENANLAAIGRACGRSRAWAWRIRWGETTRIDFEDRVRLAAALHLPVAAIDAALAATRAARKRA